MKNIFLTLLMLSACYGLCAQDLQPVEGGEFYESDKVNCLSTEQRSEIQSMLLKNKMELRKKKMAISDDQKDNAIVALGWPLQKAAGFTFNSYYATNNFIDHNSGPGLSDYNCDTRTYDGHTGIDIDTWPFPWYIYNNDLVEVIAGEAGMIVGKIDGNDDDHCSCSGVWNAVYVEHADGSTAWYGHMKKNSLTTKSIGQTVAKGEYLGVVASSGCSTQPHLHFEVYDNLNNLIDPYSGGCNTLNGTSWWASQPPNREPTLNALLTHNAAPVHGCPGSSESPNLSNVFTPGQIVYMGTYYHDQLLGDVSNMKIRRPDNTIWQDWNHTSNNTYTKSYWLWNWGLPSGGPYGTWKFEVSYKGQTYIHEFDFIASFPVQLLEFRGERNGRKSALLNWSTTSELNNYGFEVQKSGSGLDWETVGFVEGNTNTQEESRYSYTDKNPFESINYYRLKQLDFDNEFEYSNVISVDMGGDGGVSIFPNPTFNTITISGADNIKVKVFDTLGRLVKESLNTVNLDLSGFPNGIYLISIESNYQRVVEKIVKK